MDRCLIFKHKMEAAIATFKKVHKDMQKKDKQPNITPTFTNSPISNCHSVCNTWSPWQLLARNTITPINNITKVFTLLIIHLPIIMFHLALVPLKPFFPQGIKFPHGNFIVCGIYQECNPCKQQKLAVYCPDKWMKVYCAVGEWYWQKVLRAKPIPVVILSPTNPTECLGSIVTGWWLPQPWKGPNLIL